MAIVTSLRNAITAAGGTPTQFTTVGLLRELVTAYGGTPTQFTTIGLLREAITAKGGTPAGFDTVTLMRQLVTTLSLPPTTYDAESLATQIGAVAASVTAPTNFAFTPASGAAVGTPQTASYTVSGLSAPQAISISSGSYSKNGAAYTSSPGTVTNADVVTVKGTASSSYNTAVLVPVTIGTGSATFTITTENIVATTPAYSDNFNSYANNTLLVGGTGNATVTNPWSWASTTDVSTLWYLRARVNSTAHDVQAGSTSPTAASTDFTHADPTPAGKQIIYRDTGGADHFFDYSLSISTAGPWAIIAATDEKNFILSKLTSTSFNVYETAAGTTSSALASAGFASTKRYGKDRPLVAADSFRHATYGGKTWHYRNKVLLTTASGLAHTRTGTKVGWPTYNDNWNRTDNYAADTLPGLIFITESGIKREYARTQNLGGYTNGAADIPFSGTYLGFGSGLGNLQWALFDPVTNEQLTGWATATTTSGSGAWSLTARVPCGLATNLAGADRAATYPYALTSSQGATFPSGTLPYKVGFRPASNTNVEIHSQTVFGVAANLLCVGQSNNVNAFHITASGENTPDHPGGAVYSVSYPTTTAGSAVIASGYDQSTAETTSGGYDVCFGWLTYLMSQALGYPVMATNAAIAATGSSLMNPDNGLTQGNYMKAHMAAVGNAWDWVYLLQGENAVNAANTTEALAWESDWSGTNLPHIQACNVNGNVPVFVGMVGQYQGSSGPADCGNIVRRAQEQICVDRANTTLAFHPVGLSLESDGVHYGNVTTAGGQVKHAKRVALSILKYLGLSSYDGLGPKAGTPTRSGAIITIPVSLNGAASVAMSSTGDLTSFEVSASWTPGSQGAGTWGSNLTISSVTLTGNNIVLTLAADPGGPVWIRNYGGTVPVVSNWVDGTYSNADIGTIRMKPIVTPIQSAT